MSVDPITTPAPSASPSPPPDLDALVAASPASRDRVVDPLRAVSICVVVLWHWSLSVTHWSPSGETALWSRAAGVGPTR